MWTVNTDMPTLLLRQTDRQTDMPMQIPSQSVRLRHSYRMQTCSDRLIVNTHMPRLIYSTC